MSYDSLGRPDQTVIQINGIPYTYQTAYDTNGRMSAVTYPSGYVADYAYNMYGYLTSVKDNASGTAYWTADARDQELHLTQATAGNGVVTNQTFDPTTGMLDTVQAGVGSGSAVANFSYSWDTIGRLTNRTDANEQVNEDYCYDVLNRLTNSATGISGTSPGSCTASGTNIVSKSVGYDALGDITSKSDVGTTYTYPASGSGPVHGVSSITGNVDGTTNPIFQYDANGNMTCMTTASDTHCTSPVRAMTWTSYNMLASMTDNGNVLCFTYDSEHHRIAQVATTVPSTCASPGTGAATTTYINDPVSGGMEEVYLASSISWRDYIVAEGQIVAVRTTTDGGNWGTLVWGTANWETSASPSTNVTYINSDHLSSVSVLTNASGTVVERDSYDAWGRRRNANGTDLSSCMFSSPPSQTTRGYTDQEMMDSVCQINLNARVYDPTIARMISADSIVPDPFNGQSFNRYSYVNNMPLEATDPSGYDECSTNKDNTNQNCHSIDVPEGAPCWGCSGPGVWSVGDNGEVITAAQAQIAFSGGVTPSELGGYGFAGAITNFSSQSALNAPTCGGSVTHGCWTPTTGTSTNEGGYPETVTVTSTRSTYVPSLYDWASGFLGWTGMGSSVAQYGAGTRAIGTNFRLYSAVRANQYFRSFSISKWGGRIGGGLLGASVALDVTDWAFGNPNDPNTLSTQNLLENLSVDALSTAGVPGAIAGATYTGLNTFYPGGANQFSSDYASAQAAIPGQTQAVYNWEACMMTGGC